MYTKNIDGSFYFFPVSTSVVFFDDSDNENAYAVKDIFRPDRRDGTVAIGITLAKEYSGLVGPVGHSNLDLTINIILAHEMAHILQFKMGMPSRGGPWQMEPHADFMAGWGYAKWLNSIDKSFPVGEVENSAKAMFDHGDLAFNNPQHHGEPQFRAAMVRAGFDTVDLGVDAAYRKGMKLVGLG